MFGVSKFGIAIPSHSVEPVFISSENKLCNKKYSNTNEKNQEIFKDSKHLFFNVGVHDKKMIYIWKGLPIFDQTKWKKKSFLFLFEALSIRYLIVRND